MKQVEPIDTEYIPLPGALGRILRTDVIAPCDIPRHPNSAMDGYAVIARDFDANHEMSMKIVGASFAGHPFEGTIKPGECARIMTGAIIPAGADSVVMQEQVQASDGEIRFQGTLEVGNNVRAAGEDLRAGARILDQGKTLGAADIGLMASLGIAEVEVSRRPKVAFFSTGDELRTVEQTLLPGQQYDSNRYTIRAMLERIGAEAIDLGIVEDQPQAVENAFQAASSRADVVITSGGVSVGEADYVKQTLEKIGRVDFWKIAIKPGKPLAFGHLDDALFFGLPGNPVSAMVTFLLVARPALLKMMGASKIEPLKLRATTTTPLTKQPGRAEFQRGIFTSHEDGSVTVASTGPQGSGILSSMSQANCFINLSLDSANVAAGESVEIWPLWDLM